MTSFLDQVFAGRKTTGVSPNDADGMSRAFGYTAPHAGVHVDEHVAMNYSAVWACVGIISDTIASLPWHTFSRDGNQTRRVGGPADKLLNTSPNREMDAMTFRETTLGWTLTWGNGHAEIIRTRGGDAAEMLPIEPDRVQMARVRETGDLVYDVANPNQRNTVIRADDMFHVHGLGYNGLQGYSPIRMARESISAGLAMDTFAAGFFGNGANPGTVITRSADAPDISPGARQNIREDWKDLYGGPLKAGLPALMPPGSDIKRLTVPPEEAQFLQSRKFQIADIAGRWYRVPLHLVGELDRATFSNIEHQAIEFVRYTLRMWARKMELEADRKLLRGTGHHSKIDLNALLRGDTRTRGEFYRILMDRGVFSINDVLTLEDKNPVDGGDRRFVPRNAIPLDQVDAEPSKPGTGRQTRAQEGPIHASAFEDRELLKAAHACVFADAAERVIKLETKAAGRAAKKHAGDPEAFAAWLSEFYSDQAVKISETLSPCCRALARLAGTDARAKEVVADYTDRHVSESRLAIADAFADGSVEVLLGEWQRERPAAISLELTETIVNAAPAAGEAA